MGAEIAKVARVVATKTAENRPSASERSSLLHRCCHLTKTKATYKYNKATNEFAIVTRNGYVVTYYKPSKGYAYYKKQEIKYGGKKK